jgi:hypothetical protein
LKNAHVPELARTALKLIIVSEIQICLDCGRASTAIDIFVLGRSLVHVAGKQVDWGYVVALNPKLSPHSQGFGALWPTNASLKGQIQSRVINRLQGLAISGSVVDAHCGFESIPAACSKAPVVARS